MYKYEFEGPLPADDTVERFVDQAYTQDARQLTELELDEDTTQVVLQLLMRRTNDLLRLVGYEVVRGEATDETRD